jgi:hypothetical protein
MAIVVKATNKDGSIHDGLPKKFAVAPAGVLRLVQARLLRGWD